MRRFPEKDLTGKPFERWRVLSFAGCYQSKPYWKCQCSCDKKTIRNVLQRDLLMAKSKGCLCCRKRGDQKKPMPIGVAPYGGVEILGVAMSDARGQSRSHCRCLRCDKYFDVRNSSLRSGATKSCGCQIVACSLERWRNPEYKAKMKKKITKMWQNLSHRIKHRNAVAKLWSNPEYRLERAVDLREKHLNLEFRISRIVGLREAYRSF